MAPLPQYQCDRRHHFIRNNESHYVLSDELSPRNRDPKINRIRTLRTAQDIKTFFNTPISARGCIFRQQYHNRDVSFAPIANTIEKQTGSIYITPFGAALLALMITGAASLIVLLIHKITETPAGFTYEINTPKKQVASDTSAGSD